VKGSVLVAFVEWYEGRVGGRAGLASIYAHLPPEARARLDPRAR